MSYIRFLGASKEVGRSAFILSTDKNFLLDYGVKLHQKNRKEPSYPVGFQENIDAVLLSHAHLDHCGNIPAIYTFSNAHWYATPPTRDVAEVMFRDSMKIMGDNLPYDIIHFKRSLKMWRPTFYGKQFPIGETKITYRDAGHILGSSMIELIHNKKKILYTGDFKTEPTRMHKGAEYVEDVDVLLTEGTYGLRDHPDRAKTEELLISEIRETIDDGGHVLLPAFALGRSQELISILGSQIKDIPIYLDGMSKKITELYMKYPYYLYNFDEFNSAADNINFVTSIRDKKAAVREQSIIITTAGMMEGGPVLNYLNNVNERSKVIFTGYNVEGTNGWRLLNEGKIIKDGFELEVSLQTKYMDFSAHSGRKDILKFIEKANPEKLIVVHSDSEDCDAFVKELKEDHGYDAHGPEVGDKIDLF